MSDIRECKGKSIIAFPDSYCVIDIETTGLSTEWDDIIEISALKIEKSSVIDSFSSLIRIPSSLSSFIAELTGITDDMLSNAPTNERVIRSFFSFVGDSVLVGHNVGFDINFLYDNCARYDLLLSNDYVDTMRIFKKLHPELNHHRLKDLCQFYNINNSNAHRAFGDCEATYEAYSQLLSEINSNIGIDNFTASFLRHRNRSYLKAASIVPNDFSIDEESPFFNRVVVFTGVLEKMVRKDAMQLVVNIGGKVGDTVTKSTNYLVLGNNDYCSSIKDGKSSKQKKAEALKLAGNDIEIIPENVFYDMINM